MSSVGELEMSVKRYYLVILIIVPPFIFLTYGNSYLRSLIGCLIFTIWFIYDFLTKRKIVSSKIAAICFIGTPMLIATTESLRRFDIFHLSDLKSYLFYLAYAFISFVAFIYFDRLRLR